MMVAASRAVAILTLLAWLAGCATDGALNEPASDTLRTALPPAELPTYGKGDRYTFDKPDETWGIVGISDDLVTWESSEGGRQVTMFDPLLPPVRWSRPGGGRGDRKILEWSGSLFPLKAGNKLTFKTAVAVAGTAGHARFIWNCHVGHPRQVTVPAGGFAAFPVFCRRNDGRKTHAFYAPALNRPITITTSAGKGKPVLRQLVAFELGKGPRVTASKQESLPGGWAVAAVAKWGKKGLTGPRVAPGALAAANPPLSFASPPGKAPAANNRQKPRRAGRSRAAERNPARKSSRKASTTGFGVHIGSFRSENRAERGWTLYGTQYKTVLKDQPHLIVPIDLGKAKGLMYRLLAGPLKTAAQGKALCKQVKKQGGYCRVLAIPKG